MKNILIYGLQRSGTNFLESLICHNFQVKILNNKEDRSHPLHKHFRLYDEKEIIPEPKYKNDIAFQSFKELEETTLGSTSVDAVLIISKDPYSWMISYQKWANKCDWPDVDHHYMQEYNLFYGKWYQYSLKDKRIIFISYRDLILNTQKNLKKFRIHLNWTENFYEKCWD